MFLLLSAGLFFADTITGRAVLALRRMRFGQVRTQLLAPTVELAVQALLMMIPTRIELRFAHTLPLPFLDNRPVSVLLKSIHLPSAP